MNFQALVFLRPDDYGVTDWRGAIWGYAAFVVVGDELQGPLGLPTLDQVREVVRAVSPPAGSPASPSGVATPGSTEKGRENLWWGIAVVAGLGACAAGASLILARRRDRSRRL
ncbi:MAG: hypothetical protein C0506_01085 [Anaerolinea sp.]|nr:hypothetical protein [Anaerolinea sp.]